MMREQALDVVVVERRRRLVEDRAPAAAAASAPSRSRRAGAPRARATPRAARDRWSARPCGPSASAARGPDGRLVDREARACGSPPSEMLCATERFGQQAELLVDDAQPELVRPAPGCRSSTGSPSSSMRAGRRRVVAGQHLEQRRLARAVLAEQAVDRAGLDARDRRRRARACPGTASRSRSCGGQERWARPGSRRIDGTLQPLVPPPMITCSVVHLEVVVWRVSPAATARTGTSSSWLHVLDHLQAHVRVLGRHEQRVERRLFSNLPASPPCRRLRRTGNPDHSGRYSSVDTAAP